MKIVYHHRTRSTDAQRIHIQEIARAFEDLGHTLRMVSLVPVDAEQHNAERDAGVALWRRLARRVPFAYDLVQIAYNLAGIPMLMAAVWRRKVDFIYERYSLFNFAGAVTARLCRLPLVLEVNSPFALEQQRDGEIRLPRLAAWSERTICNMATRVIVVSTPLKRIMEGAGVRPEKLEVMTNGVRLSDFQAQAKDAALEESLGLRGATVIGFVGWFRNWHGLDLLIEAFHRSGLARKRVKVLLIGDGPAMGRLQERVRQAGLQDRVIFTGPLPHAEVPSHLNLIDIAVQPSANEYCCPMKILEYMALGKPVVAPRQENIREIVREGEEAILFTPGDAASFAAALERLAGNPAERLRFGANARMAVHNRGYLWRANAARVVAGCQALHDQIAESGENCEPVPAPSRIGGES